MRKYWTIILMAFCLFSSSVFAKRAWVTGEGRFYAKDNDSLGFIKNQLLSQAFRNIFTKEFKSLGLDTEFFWKRYEEKFEEYFSPIHERLKKKYGVEAPGVSNKRVTEYQEALRAKRLRLKAKFGNLNRAILSYSIKKMTRSQQVPNSRYLMVSAKVNKKLLNSIYQKFTTEMGKRNYDKLIITTDFGLKDMSWLDVGVDVESDFVSVIEEHWVKYLKENLGAIVEQVIVANDDKRKELRERLKVPVETMKELQKVATDEEGPKGIKKLGSLWLHVNVNFEKVGENRLGKKRKFVMDGDFVLVDLEANKIVEHTDFVPVQSELSTADGHKLSSTLASLVYRTPLDLFKRFPNKISSFGFSHQRAVIQVHGAKSVRELYDFIDFLTIKGVTKRITPVLKSFNTDMAQITLHFNADTTDLAVWMKTLNSLPIGKDARHIVSKQENPFNISFQ